MVKYKSDTLAYYQLHFREPGDKLMEILKEHRPDIFEVLPREYSMEGLYYPESLREIEMWRKYNNTWKLFYPFVYKFDSTSSITTK